MMNTLKLLAFLRGYITDIFQVRVKRYLSTDIALFTQSLRKKIDNGKMYYKGTCPVLQKRLQSSDQKITKQEISSSSLRALFGWPSDLLRTCVGPSSGVLRLLFGCSSGRSRSAVEADSKPSRSVAEHVSNKPRRGSEALPKSTRRGAERPPSSDNFRTNFNLSSTFYAAGSEFSSNFHRRGSTEHWSQFEEKLRKGQIWSGVGRELNGLFLGMKGTVSSPLSYRKCTESVPKRYWECTKELPEIYQRGTKQAQAISSSLVDLGYKSDSATAQSENGEDTGFVIGRGESCFKFKGFKAFCEGVASTIDSFVVDDILMDPRVLKYLLTIQGFMRSKYLANKMALVRGLLIFFSLFPLLLKAQVNSPMVIPNSKSLYIGDSVPNEFFLHQNKFIDWVSQKTSIHNLEAYRDKLIVLDFWASWCRPCLGSLMHLHEILPRLDTAKVVIIPINYEPIDKFQHLMDRFKWNHQTIYNDTFLMQYFPKRAIPHMVWIKDGRVIAKPYAKYATVENLNLVLKGGIPKLQNALNVKLPNIEQPLFTSDNALTEVVYTKKYFKIGGYVEEYARDISGIDEIADSVVYYGINQKLDYVLYDIFKKDIFSFYDITNGAIKNNLTASDLKYVDMDPLEGKDLSVYAKDSLYEAWSRNNLISYEMRIPKSLGKDKGLALLQQYWVDYLKKSKGWNVHMGLTVPKSYPIIKAKNSIAETKKLFSRPLVKDTGAEHLQYDKENDSQQKLSLVIGAMVARTKGYNVDFDNAFNRIGLPKDFQYIYEFPRWYFTKSELTSEELNSFLDQYGLKVEIEEKPVPVLVIGY